MTIEVHELELESHFPWTLNRISLYQHWFFIWKKKVSVLIVRNGKITEKNTNLTKEANLYAMTIKSDETWYNSLNPVKHGETKTKPY